MTVKLLRNLFSWGGRRTPQWIGCLLFWLSTLSAGFAQIANWQTGEVIPGTEAVVVGPGTDLSGFRGATTLNYALLASMDLTGANLSNSSLQYADLSNANLNATRLSHSDLTGANFQFAKLERADLQLSELRVASFRGANLREARLQSANFSHADLEGASLRSANFASSNLFNANLAHADVSQAVFPGTLFHENTSLQGAIIQDAFLRQATRNGFTRELLYSTASYQQGNLQGINWEQNDLRHWDLSGQDLRQSNFLETELEGVTFDDARISHTVGIAGLVASQLTSTRDYREKQLLNLDLGASDFPNLDFAIFQMAGVRFWSSQLPNARFDHAELPHANLNFANLRGASFRDTNLRDATFQQSDLAGANFEGASIEGAEFVEAGFDRAMLASTASYRNKRLTDMRFANIDFFDFDFSGQNLRGTVFERTPLEGASFRGADLTNAVLPPDALRIDLTDAVIDGTQLRLQSSQLYSTRNYQSGVLHRLLLPQWPMVNWDFRHQDLMDSDFRGSDLLGAQFDGAILDGVNFTGANLAGASFHGADISGAVLRETTRQGWTRAQFETTASYLNRQVRHVDLSANDLSGWDFSHADLTGANFENSNVVGTVFDDAIIRDANFILTQLSFAQLRTTRSYRDRDLRGIKLLELDVGGWDFTGQDLRDADLRWGRVDSRTRFSGARINGAYVAVRDGANSWTFDHLYSTASYQRRDLSGVQFWGNLSRIDFTQQDLRNSHFNGRLNNAVFQNADIRGASFRNSVDLTREQIYVTSSYQDRDLQGVDFANVDVGGWDFRDQNLSGVTFGTVDNADFTGATIRGAHLSTQAGFTRQQLRSTASYQNKDLRGINWESSDLAQWEFSDQDLRGANFSWANVADANFTNARIEGARFSGSTFDLEQLMASASFRDASLAAIELVGVDLSRGDLSDQNLSFANLERADLRGTDFSRADLRGAIVDERSLLAANTMNTILPNGDIQQLRLSDNHDMLIRNASVPITIREGMVMETGATLTFVLDDRPWESVISIDANGPVVVAGTLVLAIAPDIAADQIIGKQFQLFDADSVVPTFSSVQTMQGAVWDLGALEAHGWVSLLAVPREIDMISSAIRAGTYEARWDVNDDGAVDERDRQFWVEQIAGTVFGDSNLDGYFDSTDFIQVFRAGQYEDEVAENSIWGTGDWDGDREFSSSDLIVAFQRGGYQSSSVQVVPEPVHRDLFLPALALWRLALRWVPRRVASHRLS
jgi:uncharacterized protein YjbI with pentapeptide repeats